MKSVKIAELKDRLSEHLRAVEQGAEVTVTDRNRPIARIVPVLPTVGIELQSPSVEFATIRRHKWSSARWKMRSEELLAAERADR